MWSPRRPTPKSNPKGAFIPCPKLPFQSNRQYHVNDWFVYDENWWPLDHSLGFHSCPTQTSLRVCRFRQKVSIRPLDFGLSVKGREAKLLISWDVIGANRRHLDLRSQCESPLRIKQRVWKFGSQATLNMILSAIWYFMSLW